IAFASAPGSNANSVGEYITAALLTLADWRGFKIQNKTLGIIGHGNVGKRVEAEARALGMRYILNDPPLERETIDDTYRPLAELLEQSDIITTHVPLTKEGPDATHHMMNRDFFERAKTGVIIMNTARGAVAKGNDLRDALESGKVGASVLDVWENEPNIDLNLFANLALGTPHIAGYSFDGKVNGTRQIYEAACAFLRIEPAWEPEPLLPAPDRPEIRVEGVTDLMEAVRSAVLTVYDIRQDDKALRRIITMPAEERAAEFDGLRKNYPRRREFRNTRVIVEPSDSETQEVLANLGFRVNVKAAGSTA
ncbi:MAG: 4-phosphoerythronate dehydrogenase, partial [Candidatus Hydrogenedentes bacterium]|nr:4-phosphoerythronate dehydrogenase [Candidatus Hydrogenedentota bacterium]